MFLTILSLIAVVVLCGYTEGESFWFQLLFFIPFGAIIFYMLYRISVHFERDKMREEECRTRLEEECYLKKAPLMKEDMDNKSLTPEEKKYKAALMKKWLASQMKRLNSSDQTPTSSAKTKNVTAAGE